MLVVTRRPNERLYIGPDICVTLICVYGQSVRIGVEAPADVAIIREELIDAPGWRGWDESRGKGGGR